MCKYQYISGIQTQQAYGLKAETNGVCLVTLAKTGSSCFTFDWNGTDTYSECKIFAKTLPVACTYQSIEDRFKLATKTEVIIFDTKASPDKARFVNNYITGFLVSANFNKWQEDVKKVEAAFTMGGLTSGLVNDIKQVQKQYIRERFSKFEQSSNFPDQIKVNIC